MKEFPPFRLDAENQSLWHSGERVTLRPKPFSVLLHLLDRAGRLVTHDELLEALWPDTFIEPGAIKGHISEIRKALGDCAKRPRFIETIPRRGYRFAAQLREDLPPMRMEDRAVNASEAVLGSLERLRNEIDAAINILRRERASLCAHAAGTGVSERAHPTGKTRDII